MSGHDHSARYIVLTTGIGGADGIAELSRLTVRALHSCDGSVSPAVDVVSLTDPTGSRLADCAAAARLVGAGGRRSRFVAAALRARLLGRGPVGVLCLHLHLSPVAWLLAGRSTVFLHGIEAWRPLKRMERAVLQRARIVMANSAQTVRRFRAANPEFSDRPIGVCHLAVRERDAAPASAKPVGSSPPPFALIVGRMAAVERYKGHDLLIDLWSDVMAKVPAARLVVVGEGDDRARLEARAANLGDHVSFFGGIADGALTRLYRDCAFFLMPSRDEGFGLVFLEAMQAGKACVGCVGAAAEVIVDGVTGFVVEQEREQVLRAVLRLFRDGELRRRMGEAGAARIAGEFTEAHFQRRFRGLLELPSSAVE